MNFTLENSTANLIEVPGSLSDIFILTLKTTARVETEKRICRATFLTFSNVIYQPIMTPKHHPDVIAALSDLYACVSKQRNSG